MTTLLNLVNVISGVSIVGFIIIHEILPFVLFTNKCVTSLLAINSIMIYSLQKSAYFSPNVLSPEWPIW